MAAIAFVVLVIQRYFQDRTFDLSEEGITALIGAVGTLSVWAVSNYKRVFGSDRGYSVVELVVGVLLVLILAVVLLRLL
jgi:hypothetical protein